MRPATLAVGAIVGMGAALIAAVAVLSGDVIREEQRVLPDHDRQPDAGTPDTDRTAR